MLKTLKSKLYRKSKTQGRYVLRDTIIFPVVFYFFLLSEGRGEEEEIKGEGKRKGIHKGEFFPPYTEEGFPFLSSFFICLSIFSRGL